MLAQGNVKLKYHNNEALSTDSACQNCIRAIQDIIPD